jgi:hypothetical protein
MNLLTIFFTSKVNSKLSTIVDNNVGKFEKRRRCEFSLMGDLKSDNIHMRVVWLKSFATFDGISKWLADDVVTT